MYMKDGKGRKWYVGFTQYQEGLYWKASHNGFGFWAGKCFETKELAQADARQVLGCRDALAQSQEYSRRARGTPCQLTAEDREAIRAAGSL